MRAALALLMLAAPCWAEPWIDYDLLFQQNADKVVVRTDALGETTRQIDFDNGVSVSCSDQGCVGLDQNGAIGCVWSIYSSLLAVAEVCGIPKERTANIAEYHRLLTTFVARNAVPPRSLAEIEALHQSEVDHYRRGGDGPLDCAAALAPDSDVGMMLDGLMSQEVDLDAATKALATPRLPVMNPCL